MNKRIFLVLIIGAIALLGVILFLTKKPSIEKPKPVLEKELRIFNWEDYLSQEVIEDFERKFGAEVFLETFEDSEYAFSVIQSQPDKYDLFVIEDEYVVLMKNLKLIIPINHQKIPNLKNLRKEARENHYDPGNLYCVPYVSGYTGILINTKYVRDFDGTRRILFDEKYKGKIIMPNDSSEILINAIFVLGYDLNKATKEQFDEAVKLAFDQKDLVLGYYDPMTQRELILKEKAWIAYIYSTEAFLLTQQNPHLRFFAPKEGVLLWADNWCLPKDAKNKELAHLFLNYILEPEIAAKNSANIGTSMSVEGMEKYLLPEFVEITRELNFPLDTEIFQKSRYSSPLVLKEEYRVSSAKLSPLLEESVE